MKIIIKMLVVFLILSSLLLTPKPASADCATEITWSGIDWTISDWAGSDESMDDFVFDPCKVTIDSSGRLVLTLEKVGDVWKGAEISTVDSQSFGSYIIQLESSLATLPPSAVFGFFPYKGVKYDGTNEIDIEYSQWGYPDADNWNYSVYPAKSTGEKNSQTFGYSTELSTTHTFYWYKKGVSFQSFTSIITPSFLSTPFTSWNFAPKNYLRDVPQTSMPLLINLWAHKTAEMGTSTKYTVVINKVVIP